MANRRIIIFALILISIGLFYYLNLSVAKAEDGHVIISEIQITGGAGKTRNDFVELYNPTGADFNLKGYRLVKRAKTGNSDTTIKSWTGDTIILKAGYYLWANSADGFAGSLNADVSTSQIISSDNGVALRLGKADEGEIIDSVGWGNCENIFIEGSVFPNNPEAGKSMEREQNIDTDNNSADFIIKEIPTPRNARASSSQPEIPVPVCGNGQIEGGEECDDGNLIPGDGCGADCITEDNNENKTSTSSNETDEDEPADNDTPTDSVGTGEYTPGSGETYRLGDIIFNEIVSDPTDNEVEWIELINRSGKEINLSGWSIEEGGGSKTLLDGNIGILGENRFFIIEKPKGNLNNSGDILILRSGGGVLIDKLAYGNWDDGDTGNNAPKAGDPNSIARKIDGHNTFNNANDFAITATPTKGAGNIITALETEEENEISAEDYKKYDYNKGIIISEIYPNPPGNDNPDELEQGEFIELYNKSDKSINLQGWSLGDETKRKYRLVKPPSGSKSHSVALGPSEFLIVYRADSKIALNNTNDSVKLFQPLKDEPLQIVKYEKAKEGWSYNLKETKFPIGSLVSKWSWSETVTPGAANNIKAVNHPPQIDFDCPETAILARPVIFDSSDTIDEDSDSLSFFWDFGDGFTNTLVSPEHTFFTVGAFTVKLTVRDNENELSKEKIINIVESFSLNNTEVLSLTGVYGDIVISELLPNPEGRDEDEEFIEIFNNGDTRINLLNWRIDDSEGGSRPYEFIDSFWLEAGQYFRLDREESGLALNNSNDSVRLFDGTEKLVDQVEYEKSAEGEAYARGENNKWFWTTTPTPNEKNIIRISKSARTKLSAPKVSAGSGKAKQPDEEIVITTTPELVRNLDPGARVRIKGVVAVKPGILGTQYFYIVGSHGIQVYNYKKDFPDMKIGDYVEVYGELAVSAGEWRVKTKTKEDIDIIERKEPPMPEAFDCDKITEETVGRLISVSGEVVEKKGSSIYLDDNSDEIKIYIRKATGISVRKIDEGDRIAVTGILGSTKSGLRLMPREPGDIVKKDPETAGVGRVLGEVSVANEWEIEARDRKLELFKYLLVIAGAVIFTLIGLLFRMRKK